MIVKGFNSNTSALRELIYASSIAISGTMAYAHQLFPHITEPDTFMWNTMIRGSAQSPSPLNAISLYSQMENGCVRPDKFTFPFVLKACTRLCWVKTGFGVHGRVFRLGFESNTFVRNTLIYFHANCGDLAVARALFDGSAKRDVVAWSALTAGYARRGELGVARQLFDEMPVKDLVSWNVMITGVCALRVESAGLEMFEEMRSVGELPDEVTMLSLLSACTDLGDLDAGQRIHCCISEMGFRDLSVLLGNALIDMYAKCGSIVRALEVFQGMREKDVSTWNSVLGGLAFHGHAEKSIHLFTEMRKLKIRPDEITFVGVLVACSHAGRVEEGRQYFDLMRDEYNIEPNIRHYGCMVDLLGRAGLLNEAFDFIDTMKDRTQCHCVEDSAWSL
ncbi:Pentatricopeptide repeat-containing protein [Vitis vinifera]|uniref:Pentatricopeptide repeat-containing protein n=1 Tax=Vitis vinifera TaxID=29760 RepID=A0A438D4R9_VITVI|nr:Pentatricopeptide repeat-containing protein [Vitis vinifera]